MQRIWPTATASELHGGELPDLEQIYAFPDLDEPYIKVNFVMSANAVTAVDGVSGGLSFDADRLVFGLLRELCDVVLVGAGTARAENYRGARSSEPLRTRRRERGLNDTPPIAVVSASAAIDPDAVLLTDTNVPPIILTSRAAPTQRVEALRAAGADVEVLGEDHVPGVAIVAALQDRELRRVVCEGGSRLLGDLVVAGLVDEMCLSIAEKLVGGSTGVTRSEPCPPTDLLLRSAIAAPGGLLLRYVRPA